MILFMVLGVSYAFFSYSRVSDANSQLITGEVYMHYKDGLDTINLENAFPESEEVVRNKSDNIIDFTINGKNTTTNNDIYYEIKLIYGEDIEGKTRLKDKSLKFDLIEIINDESNMVLSGMSYDEINDTRIYANKINRNTTEEVEITYQLRMWVSDDTLISDTVPNAYYTTSVYKNSYANVKVSVYGDFEYKKLAATADTIINKVGTDGIVALDSNGSLSNMEDEIVAYRYSGVAKTCDYVFQGTTYALNTEEEVCPDACYFRNEEGYANDNLILPMTADYFVNNQCTGYIYKIGSNYSQTSVKAFCLKNKNSTNVLKLAHEKGDLYYRYLVSPVSTTPNNGVVKNYIIFNNEMWRIIGAFKQLKSNGDTEWLVKIIKDNPISDDLLAGTTYTYNGVNMVLKEETDSPYGYFYWNYDNYFNETSSTDWTTSALQYYLNDESNTSSYYNSINASYRNMIESVVYNLGNVSSNNIALQAYNSEKKR